ncbi:hypothetical protein AB836_00295 [Rickettsiales bacterium (ex Bugula neritina AB1)]|nr:hypothetical protein AB836_00295 [Rickettsiales bacterium (ex Bugula neritina AB1)]
MMFLIRYLCFLTFVVYSLDKHTSQDQENNIFDEIGKDQKEREDYTNYLLGAFGEGNNSPLISFLDYRDPINNKPFIVKFLIKKDNYGYTIYLYWYDKKKTKYKIFDSNILNELSQILVYNNIRDGSTSNSFINFIKYILGFIISVVLFVFTGKYIYYEYTRLSGLVSLKSFMENKKSELSFKDLLLGFDETTHNTIKESFITPLITQEEEENISFFPSLLLYGPGGTGKTTLSIIISEFIKNISQKFHQCNVYMLRPANLTPIIPGISKTKVIGHMFKQLIKTGQNDQDTFHILFFDECEMLILSSEPELVSAFKAGYTDAKTSNLDNICVIITTNIPIDIEPDSKFAYNIDSAALSRLIPIEVISNTSLKGIKSITENLIKDNLKNTYFGNMLENDPEMKKKLVHQISKNLHDLSNKFINRNEYQKKLRNDPNTKQLSFAPTDMITPRTISSIINTTNSKVLSHCFKNYIKEVEENIEKEDSEKEDSEKVNFETNKNDITNAEILKFTNAALDKFGEKLTQQYQSSLKP